MNFVGIDLHKKASGVCALNQERKGLPRTTLAWAEAAAIRSFFAGWRPCRAAVEATARYEWLGQVLEPLAEGLVLAHPKKLRVLAESTRQSDKIDAHVLADFLALDLIPPAYRPTPRQRPHRALVRQRYFLGRQITAVENKIRQGLAGYNADRRDLFSDQGQAYLAAVPVAAADRFVLGQLLARWRHLEEQRQALGRQLRAFAKKAPVAEQGARAVLGSIPEVGPVTVDVVLSERGDVRRFRSAKKVSAYAGLAPGQRESAGRAQALGISKEGSPLLRWALVEAAWRLVRRSRRGGAIFEALAQRRGRKKAIVAVARRLLGVMGALLRTGQRYRRAS